MGGRQRLKLRGSRDVERGSGAVGDNGVTVSLGVVEVFPNKFTMTAVLRPADGDGIAARAWCSLSPGGEVSKAMRGEFIALAHAAKYIH